MASKNGSTNRFSRLKTLSFSETENGYTGHGVNLEKQVGGNVTDRRINEAEFGAL